MNGIQEEKTYKRFKDGSTNKHLLSHKLKRVLEEFYRQKDCSTERRNSHNT